jgi:hypothetical protein
MTQRLEVSDHARGPSLLAQSAGDANRSAIKPKIGHALIVREGTLLQFARTKARG